MAADEVELDALQGVTLQDRSTNHVQKNNDFRRYLGTYLNFSRFKGLLRPVSCNVKSAYRDTGSHLRRILSTEKWMAASIRYIPRYITTL